MRLDSLQVRGDPSYAALKDFLLRSRVPALSLADCGANVGAHGVKFGQDTFPDLRLLVSTYEVDKLLSANPQLKQVSLCATRDRCKALLPELEHAEVPIYFARAVAGPRLQTLVLFSAASDPNGRLIILLDEVLQRCPGLKVLSLQFIGGLSRSLWDESLRHAGIEVLVLYGAAASSVTDLAVLGFTALRALELYQLDVVRLALLADELAARKITCRVGKHSSRVPTLANWFKTLKMDAF